MPQLNHRANRLAECVRGDAASLNVNLTRDDSGASILDFGVEASGGLQAGVQLARLCMSDLADVSLQTADTAGLVGPHVTVATDRPLTACLLSQYAGWQVKGDKFFGMGSGPMRAVAAREELFEKLRYCEASNTAVGVIETSQIPTHVVCNDIAEKCGISTSLLTLAIAPTSSIAGTVQIVARSVETALHKLFELGFDVRRIISGFGSAPLPPVAADDLMGIGLTNDAILYGARVQLYVNGDDASLEDVGPKVPADSADCYGEPFLKIFEAAGHDFYKIDPHLFSPAEITFINVESGHSFRFGRINADVLRESFGA